jgi:hypothetical protein
MVDNETVTEVDTSALMLSMLAEIRDHLYSLRLELMPVTVYYREAMEQAAQAGGYAQGLPSDFPARDALHEAGITSIAQIPRTMRGLKELVGKDAANSIMLRFVQEKPR